MYKSFQRAVVALAGLCAAVGMSVAVAGTASAASQPGTAVQNSGAAPAVAHPISPAQSGDQSVVHPDGSTYCAGSARGDKVLTPGSDFDGNTYICANGWEFFNQCDGNLVIYNSAGAAVWANGTDHWVCGMAPGGYTGEMQSGGNFWFTSGWSTHTDVPGSYVCFQNDGNMVVYAPSGAYSCSGKALWASGT